MPVVAAAPTTPSTAGILKLNLIHAPTSTVLKELSNGLVVDLKTYNVSPQFNIQAVELTTAVTRVLFVETNQSEGVKPFAFCGDTGGKYNICPTMKLGENKLTVIAMYATGKTLGQVSLAFRVVDTRTAPVPVPVAAPVAVPVGALVTALIMVDEHLYPTRFVQGGRGGEKTTTTAPSVVSSASTTTINKKNTRAVLLDSAVVLDVDGWNGD